ncbi:hypothetical protein AVEN_67070-1 [Araneus ventricosus]|uniref:Uncharacterized protein n=1 Tax=Araneus ventricosus TaxID=182803 RepID=A0A4Y2RYY4_ARAVE|nr:hypothetical protein AVEN_67070-1 [Araneus ventricosus]
MTEPELAPPSPSCSTTSARGRLTLEVRFSVHQAHKHDGSSLESGFEPGALPPQSRDLTTRPLPRIPLMTIRTLRFYEFFSPFSGGTVSAVEWDVFHNKNGDGAKKVSKVEEEKAVQDEKKRGSPVRGKRRHPREGVLENANKTVRKKEPLQRQTEKSMSETTMMAEIECI